MKSFVALAGTFFLTVIWALALPEASALPSSPQVPKIGISLTVPIMLAVVLVCLVVGFVLRSFSKPPAELSLNQRTK